MIHRQHGIVFSITTRGKETVRREGSESQYPAPHGFSNGRPHHLLLLAAYHSAVARMGVQPEYSDTRLHDPEIGHEHTPQLLQPAHNQFRREHSAHLCERNVYRHETYFHAFAAHDHEGLAAEPVREKLRVSGKSETGLLHVLLVDRSRHHHVDVARSEVVGRPAQGVHRFGTALPRGRTRFDAHLAGTGLHQVHPLGTRLTRASRYLKRKGLSFGQSLPVI